MSPTLSSSSSAAGRSRQRAGWRSCAGPGLKAMGSSACLDDSLGQPARRVVGAGGAAVDCLGHEQRAGEQHERVCAQQGVKRRDAFEQLVVVAARGSQPE